MSLTAGVDIGSLTTKAVIVRDGRMAGAAVLKSGVNSVEIAEKALQEALEQAGAGAESLDGIVATGYGRIRVPFAQRRVTEITCHARGIYHLWPEVRTVIDIGGQDSKVILLDAGGKVRDFVMNEKCAAGTGRFLEVMAGALDVPVEEMGAISQQAGQGASISSMCTVFAESEVVSLVAEGRPVAEIIRGLHNAVAQRVVAMAQRVGWEEPVAMTGGVAKNPGVVKSLEETLGTSIRVPPDPQIIGALGAALLAIG
ncbi:R-phenyllactate dehydratase activator [Moorella thermoacetica]|uniref:R-phenyllactate dehydratase activator n=1 Tax=Neomoorella thermoacetica TaxID=1525 RepID=A0A1J5JSA0_NEOTH|nr:acyl-CoA dehydratase activase [Moorella thermoacetica]OIQ09587.1 R-phenyllactate dehydratase activator [Moorella thermoacetica]